MTCKFVVPLFVRSQHHRHRTWSYNEISRRYTDKDLQFYLPKSFRTQHKTDRQASNEDEINPLIAEDDFFSLAHYGMPANERLKDYCERAVDLYETMLEGGICREQARMVLPQNLYTEYYGTVNLNNALKYIVLRDDEHAQWEIQQTARALKEILTDLYPVAMAGFEELVLKK